jgi:uncharacterized protein YwgA
MLEKDKNQRFDIIEVENEIKRMNDSVVHRSYINDASPFNNKASSKKLEKQDYLLKQRYIVVKPIRAGSSTDVILVNDTHDNTIKQLVNNIVPEL